MLFTGTTAQARVRLERMLSNTLEPVLTTAEVTDLLMDSKRAGLDGVSADDYTDFVISTAYALGAVVVPTTRNGHYYTASVAGTSASSEPTWPTTSGATVVSGSATFTESGATSWSPTFDLDWAASDGWAIKEARASNMNQFIQDGRGSASDYLYLNCQRMKEYYQSRIQSSAPILGRRDSYLTAGLIP